MFDAICFLIWSGGVLANWDKEIGFINRLTWPMEVGEHFVETFRKKTGFQ